MKRTLIAAPAVLLLLLSCARIHGPLNTSVANHPWLTLLLLAGAASMVRSRRMGDATRRLGHLFFESRDAAFYSAVWVAAVVLYSLAGRIIFQSQPHLDDGVASLFQARLFARGEIVTGLAPARDFFWQIFVLDDSNGLPHRCGMYPPGWPALLVPGVWLGMPWIINPILGGALAVAAAMLAAEMFNRTTGRITALLTLMSPYAAVLSATFLSHIATALLCTLCAWSVFRLVRTGTWHYGAVAGLTWGWAFLCRPLTALVVGTVIALIPLFSFKQALKAWRAVALALLLAGAAGGIQAGFQKVTTGDASTPGHVLGMGRRGKFGFVKLDWARTHTPRLGMEHTLDRLRFLNDRLTGWPVGVFVLAAIPLFCRSARWRDAWLLLPVIALAFVYAFYWYYEILFPARYLEAGTPLVLVLAGRGLQIIFEKSPSAKYPAAAVLACLLFALITVPADYLSAFEPDHGDVEPNLMRTLKKHSVENAVVFYDAVDRDPIYDHAFNDYYATAFLHNDIDLKGDVIFARNLRGRNVELFVLYPGRRYYLYRYSRERHKPAFYEMIPKEELFEVIALDELKN